MNTKKETIRVPGRNDKAINDLLREHTSSRLLRLNTSFTWVRYTDGINTLQELSQDWVLVQEISKLVESSWLVSASLSDRRLATHQKWLFDRGDDGISRLVARSVAGGEELFARPLMQMQNYPFKYAEIWADWHMNIHAEPGWTLYLPSEHEDVVSGSTSHTIHNVLWSQMENDRDPWE